MKGLTRNTWKGGLNTDTDKSQLDPIYYVAAHNLDSASDGTFFSLRNIKGTEKVKALVNSPDTTVLGAFPSKYLIGGSYKKSITLFTMTGPAGSSGKENKFKIWCYDTEANNVYELFEETITSAYITSNRVVDAIGYAENNIDHLYFTDDYNEIRYLRCEIPASYTANFLTSSDLSVQRLGASGAVKLNTIATGGSLLSGSYQYAYRMVDPVNKRFTKWSSLTSPIHVYSAANSSTAAVYSDYGLPTNFKIGVNINLPQQEIDDFYYFQIAVIENVYPTGPEVVVQGQNQTFVASLLPIESVADYLIGTTVTNYEHKTNAKVSVVPIEELVVDLAAIKNVKTLSIKKNKLVIANIDYHNLEFDNGTPSADGSILTRTSSAADIFSSHEESIYKGHFRDEVYRYGVVYFDKYGNRAPVKVLDLNAITDNAISGTLPDVRFPSRSAGSAWSLFDTSSPARLRSLGLRLNVFNHPKWAVGFEIVRAKRIKKIISQTPVVPMTYAQGIGALDEYPSQAVTVVDGTKIDNEYDNTQPQTTSKIYMPKNLFWPDQRAIVRRTYTSGSGSTLVKTGEAELARVNKPVSLAMIFPQNFMYGNEPFILSGAEKTEAVDYCALRLNVTDYTDSAGTAGDHQNTKIKGTFYALESGDYFFDPAHGGTKSISETPSSIKGYTTFENLSEPGSLSGKSIMDYSALVTEGIDMGFAPKIQKCVVIDAPTDSTAPHDIMTNGSYVFASAGTKNPTGSGVAIFSGNSSLVYEYVLKINNKYINKYTGFSGSPYVQALKIVNIVNEYGDDRYGDIDTQHEFISTGTSYFFTTSELATVAAGTLLKKTVDVWGGDCFVSPHTFKVADGAYSTTNQPKFHSPASFDSSGNLVTKWGKYFRNTSGTAISLTVGVEAAAQFITVVLESEYNGGVMAQDLLVPSGTTVNNIPVLTPEGGEEALESPLTYRYNINLSKQNDEKVYFPRPEFNFTKNTFPARVAFSDQKIYNTDAVGFDIFRVLNFLDLEEKNGEITKLAIEGDNLYAIQERGIIGLPVGETQLTTTDAGQLAVGTSGFFGRPMVIDNSRGSQHIKGIVETGDRIYIPDHANKAVYSLAGNRLEIISDLNNATAFREFFNSSVSERSLVGIHDPLRGQFWIASPSQCYVFNEKRGQWVTNLEFPNAALRCGLTTNQDLFLVGMEGDQIYFYKMYKGNANTLFDATVTPRVTFVVNPDDPLSKVFTNQAYITTERLATVDFTVEREAELSDQTVSGTVIDVSPRGGNYRIKLPRAAGSERLRGLRLLTTIKWKTTNLFSSLSEVLTKYRFEARTPF